MPCFTPLKGYRSHTKSENGKYPVVFNLKDGYLDKPVTLPCGQCIGCRLERSRQWAIRCVHEASLWEQNCFITLTFNDQHAPLDGSLDVRDFQLFMKRLRKKFGANIRFYHCGEYGTKYGRPHYHACLFNFDFQDKTLWKVINGQRLYRSAALEELWPFGYSSVGTVTFESAAYVARYIMKKITGEQADSHYERVDSDGVVTYLKPEYTTMSRRPGIASAWFEKYKTDVYPGDFVVLKNKKMKPPRYYDNIMELKYPSEIKRIKSKRVLDSKKHIDNNTPERLRVREICQLTKLKQLPRNLDY